MTDPQVSIEPATMEDLDPLVDRWVDLVESQAAFGSHILGRENRERGRDILAQYISKEMVAVARSAEVGADHAPVDGFVMYYLESGLYDQRVTRGIVENLYVVPDARGSGIGSALMDFAESALADRGAEVVALSVMAANTVGRTFYEERGYKPHRVVYERSLMEDTGDTERG